MLPDAISGQISIWKGAIVNIPSGWVICDGNNGTPDLRDKFVVGSGSSYAVNDTGGLAAHDHRFRGDSHVHTVGTGANIEVEIIGFSTTTNPGVSEGNFNSSDHLSPYYALAYIMYL